MVKCYRDLKVWEKAMDLVVESYRITKLLPRHEMFGLIAQIQRAAVSIPANIAEGLGGSTWAITSITYRLLAAR